MAATNELLPIDAGQCNAESPQWLSLSSGGNKNSDLFHPENNKNSHH